MITASISGGDRWEKLLKKLAEARLGLRRHHDYSRETRHTQVPKVGQDGA